MGQREYHITFRLTGKKLADSFLLRLTIFSLRPSAGLGSAEAPSVRLGWISCRDDHRCVWLPPPRAHLSLALFSAEVVLASRWTTLGCLKGPNSPFELAWSAGCKGKKYG